MNRRDDRRRAPDPSAPAPVAPGAWASRAAAIAALIFVAALQVRRIDDSDTWWHLASGRRIAQTGEIARVDPFSYTAAGAPWINRQWLFDLGLYGSWQAGGPVAASLGVGVLALAAWILLYARARRRLPAWAAGVFVFLAASAALERFTVRPEVLSFVFLAAYLLILDGPLGWGAAGSLLVLQAVWANCHTLSVLGLVLIGAELLGAAASDRARAGRLAATLAGATLAEAATPFGIPGALFSLRLLTVIRGGELSSRVILEHRPTVVSALPFSAAFGLVCLLAVAGLAVVMSWRRWRISHLALAGAFTTLAFLARRNVALIGFGLLPLVVDGLAPLVGAADRWLARARLRGLVGAALAVVFAVTTARVVGGRFYVGNRMVRAFGLGESRLVFPAAALDFLEREAPGARVFNDDMLGGYLIWRGHPVFYDGRVQVYPEQITREYNAVLVDAKNFPDVVTRYGITAAVLYHPAPGRLELATAVARLPGWRVAYVDGGAVVLLADGTPSGVPAGIDGPAIAVDATGIAGRLESLVRRVRLPVEEAVTHYERGRAVIALLGRAGVERARADFSAALDLWPGFQDAIAGLNLVDAVEAGRR